MNGIKGTEIMNQLQKIIIKNSKVTHLDPKQSFLSLGIDSLKIVSITSEIEKLYDIELEPTLLLDYDTMEKLVKFIVSKTS